MARLTFFCFALCFEIFLVLIFAEIPYEPFIDKALNHENVCNQKSDKIGPCRAGFPRFSYFQKENVCRLFLYGGCQGNDNSFHSEGHCKRVCIDKQPCAIPSLTQPNPGCRYDESLNERGCPKYALVCDVKPGRCPTDHQRAHHNATIFECDHSDERCSGAKKCCKIDRSRLCLTPES